MDLSNRMLTLEMSIGDLYEIFLHEIKRKIAQGDNKEKNELVLGEIQKGNEIRFDFDEFVKERYKRKKYVKSKNGKEVGGDIIKIKIEGKEIPEKEFEDEILRRARLMRGWIWENMTIEKVGETRRGEIEE